MGIHLYAFGKGPNDQSYRIYEDSDYSSKQSFANDLRANEIKVKSVSDNRDMYIIDNSDFKSVIDVKKKLKFYKDMQKESNNPKIWNNDIEELQKLINEAMKISLTESNKLESTNSSKITGYRSIGLDELEKLLQGQEIIGNYDSTNEIQTTIKAKNIVMFFTDPIFWKDKYHKVMIKCTFDKSDIIATGKGQYFGDDNVTAKGIWNGKAGDNDYYLKEIAVPKYSLSDVDNFINPKDVAKLIKDKLPELYDTFISLNKEGDKLSNILNKELKPKRKVYYYVKYNELGYYKWVAIPIFLTDTEYEEMKSKLLYLDKDEEAVRAKANEMSDKNISPDTIDKKYDINYESDQYKRGVQDKYLDETKKIDKRIKEINEVSKYIQESKINTKLIDTTKLPDFEYELESRSDSIDYRDIWNKYKKSKSGKIRCTVYELDCISAMYNNDIYNYEDISKILYESKEKIQEASRNELLAIAKSQTITRYNKSAGYKGFSISDIDITNIFKTDTIVVTCKVGKYYDTIELQDILVWIQMEAERNPNNQVNTKAITQALMESIDALEIKVNCTCPDFGYRFAYQATQLDYKYGKPENRPANITNPHNYGSLCFTGDTLILTDKGLISIKDIKIGDKVFTHKGRLKEVEFISSHYDEELLESKIGTEVIRHTKNHPFYIQNKEGTVEWKSLDSIDWKEKYSLTPKLQLEENVTLPKGYAFMLGLFLSDGHIDIRPQKNGKLYLNQLTIALDKQYKQFYEEKMNELGFKFRFKEKTYSYNTNCINLQIYDKQLKKFIIENGGYTYKDKHSKFLNNNCFNWSKQDKLDLINGFFWGDGQFGVTGNKNGYLQYILYNSNKDIMQKLYILIRSFTYARIFSMTKKPFYSERMQKTIMPCEHYLICLRGEHIKDILQEDCKNIKTKNSYNHPISNYEKLVTQIDNLDYFKTNINKKNIKKTDGDIVYNIQVKDDESYLITRELYAVHNCKHLISMLSNKKWLQQVTGTIMDFISKNIDKVNEYLKPKEGMELTLPNELARQNAKAGFYSKLFKDNEEEPEEINQEEDMEELEPSEEEQEDNKENI